MGLIAAALGSANGVLADQWKEYFYCDSLGPDVLVSKGKHSRGGRSTNSKGSDNIISNGSVIAVNEGQCMIIVDQGEIVEVAAQAGEYTFDTSKEPSIFAGNLGQSILDSFKTFVRRVGFGGDTARDQRIYYFNTKDIIGNKYGTASPVPYRVVDKNVNLDLDIAIRCFGEYAYRMVDPILFYKNICGNVPGDFTRDQIDSQLKSELLTHLQEAFAKISEMGIRYSALPGHTDDIAKALNEVLSDSWGKQYGIQITQFGVSSVKASEEDEDRIKQIQMAGAMSRPDLQAGMMTQATAAAMQSAAKNESAGPMMAFAGMNMAANAGGGVNIAALNAQAAAAGAAAAPKMEPVSGWKCPNCGAEGNQGKFCGNCGTAKPAAPAAWICPKCGAENTGKFCGNCGTAKPEEAAEWTCPSCGSRGNTGKFCGNCGKQRP
ncbi:MAG: SPFH domain-containing protein [Lachnospiraceae bacterium]|nr:SPFH domain-containing protein [Lachnospiraceae bacterium]